MSVATALRALLARPVVTRAVGAADPLSARLAAQAGCEAIHLSGAAVAAVGLGLPDLGYAGLADLADAGARVAFASGLPVVADADTGYGNALHAAYTVRRYRAAGVAALHVEDQVFPKRCGHMAGKALIPADEMAAKVAAMVDAAEGELVVIARTDAASVEGTDAAVERVAAYAAAGAELVFVEGVTDLDVLRAAHGAAGVAVMVNASEAGGPARLPSDDELVAAGVRLVIHPVAGLLAAAGAARSVYASLASTGTAGDTPMMAWSELTDAVGLGDHLAAEQRWS